MYPLQLQTFTLGAQSIALLVPDLSAVQKWHEQNKQQGVTPFPYWAQVWPAALALGEFLLQHRHYIKDKVVLELAAGLGLPSLVAAQYAKQVTCTDYIPDAVTVVKQSAQHSGFANMVCRVLNWHQLPQHLTADVLLLSDVNYEPPEFEVLYKILQRFINSGTTIILSTPQRLVAKSFIEQLLPWCVLQQQIDVPGQGHTVPVSILVLKEK